jgi:hypothetical protein
MAHPQEAAAQQKPKTTPSQIVLARISVRIFSALWKSVLTFSPSETGHGGAGHLGVGGRGGDIGSWNTRSISADTNHWHIDKSTTGEIFIQNTDFRLGRKDFLELGEVPGP